MAVAGFIKERPDGRRLAGVAMGTCYSVGKNKLSPPPPPLPPPPPPPPPSSSLLRKGPAGAPTGSSARSSSGKTQRSQSLRCYTSSQKTLQRHSSAGKDRGVGTDSAFTHHVSGTSLLHATDSIQGGSPTSSAATLQARNGHVQDWGGGSISSHAAGEECTSILPIHDASPTHQVQLSAGEGNGNDDIRMDECRGAPTNQTSFNNAASGDGRSHEACMQMGCELNCPALTHTASSSITSPHQTIHCATSSKTSRVSETPCLMQSCRAEIKMPSSRSGVGAYELLTPKKPMTDTSSTTLPTSKSDGPLRRVGSHASKIDLGATSKNAWKGMENSSLKSVPLILEGTSKGQQQAGVKELCKNCKSGKWESVCFISNEGRITAANTGPPTVCHFHHCNSPRCAANANYQPPSPSPRRKTQPAKTRASRSQDVKTMAKGEFQAADESDSFFSTKSFLHEDGSENTLPAHRELESERNELGIIDVCDGISVSKEVLDLGCRHIDGTEMPSSIEQSTLGDLVTKDPTESVDCGELLQSRKPSMERMRRKYLECLKEQEAEIVRLRRQEMIARKQAGEWMLDSAIGEILQKLAPDGEAGVKVIVEAFETIMQQGDSELHQEDNTA